MGILFFSALATVDSVFFFLLKCSSQTIEPYSSPYFLPWSRVRAQSFSFTFSVCLLANLTLLDKDFSQGVRSSRRDKRLARMESHVEYRLVEFLAVRCDLLHAGLVLQVPQPNAAIVTWNEAIFVFQ